MTAFDNLYGTGGPVNRQPVPGLADDARQVNTTQITQDRDAYGCLLQNDVNLSSPTPIATTCVDKAHQVPASGFANTPFTIDAHIPQPTGPAPPKGRRPRSTECSRTAPAPSRAGAPGT